MKRQKSHKQLVINAVYSQSRTRVLTAVFALLILRPLKSPLKSKGLALFRRHRHHLTENFSTPESEFVTKDGGNSSQNELGLSVFADFFRISPFYRRRASIPLRSFAARPGASPPRLRVKKRKVGTGKTLRFINRRRGYFTQKNAFIPSARCCCVIHQFALARQLFVLSPMLLAS